MSDTSHYEERLYRERMTTETERQRPFMLLRPTMSLDGAQWCALYGDNIQIGVCGYGNTPLLAAEAFDNAWFGRGK